MSTGSSAGGQAGTTGTDGGDVGLTTPLLRGVTAIHVATRIGTGDFGSSSEEIKSTV